MLNAIKEFLVISRVKLTPVASIGSTTKTREPAGNFSGNLQKIQQKGQPFK